MFDPNILFIRQQAGKGSKIIWDIFEILIYCMDQMVVTIWVFFGFALVNCLTNLNCYNLQSCLVSCEKAGVLNLHRMLFDSLELRVTIYGLFDNKETEGQLQMLGGHF